MGVIVIFDRSLIDLFLKWENSNKFGAWFPIWVAKKLTLNKEADLCYLLHADPSIVLSRKGKDVHSLDEIEELWARYQNLSNEYFKIIDTSNTSPEKLVGEIINDVFNHAAISTE